MIRLLLYRALPHRRGVGGAGHVTGLAQLRRELSLVQKIDVFALWEDVVLHGSTAGFRLRKPARANRRRQTPRFSERLRRSLEEEPISLASENLERPASPRAPRHPQIAVSQPCARHRERHRTMCRSRLRHIAESHRVPLPRIEQPALRMADRVSRSPRHRWRAAQAQLLDRHLALVHEGKLDAVARGTPAHQQHRAGNRRMHRLRR